MPGFDHARKQIVAVWKMAKNDASWREDLDFSLDGVFRSFEAAFIALPLAALLYWLSWRAAGVSEGFPTTPLLAAGAPAFVATQLAAFAVEWAASLVFLAAASRSLKIERRIAPVVAGFNWAQPPITLIQTVTMGAIVLSGSSLVGGALALPAIALQIAILWGVVRRGFERDTGVTIALLAGLVLVSVLVTSVVAAAGAGLFVR